MKYLILIEKSKNNYSAYAPDLPGCVAAAKTKEETIVLMKEAMLAYIQLMREAKEPIPEPHTESAFLEVGG